MSVELRTTTEPITKVRTHLGYWGRVLARLQLLGFETLDDRAGRPTPPAATAACVYAWNIILIQHSERSVTSATRSCGVRPTRLPRRSAGGPKKRRLLNNNFIKRGDGGFDSAAAMRREAEQDALDARCGFATYKDGPSKLGWLVNFNTCTMEDKETGQPRSAVACYFTCQSGEMFKCKVAFAPYFYLQVKNDRELEVEAYLRRKFEGACTTLPVSPQVGLNRT
jgi:hypothetical protein